MTLFSDYAQQPQKHYNEKNKTIVINLQPNHPLQPSYPFDPPNPLDPWNRRPVPQRLITTPQSDIVRPI